MKQRKSKQVRLLSGMLIGIVMIAVLARIVYLNYCYPSPKVITGCFQLSGNFFGNTSTCHAGEAFPAVWSVLSWTAPAFPDRSFWTGW